MTALLGGIGFLGGVGLVLALVAQLGLDPSGAAAQALALVVAAACLWWLVAGSAELARLRLGGPHRLVDGVAALAYVAIPLALDEWGLSRWSGWPAPAPPHWLATLAAAALLVGVAALTLECGVFGGERRPGGTPRRRLASR
jgi:hypothetical protein